MDYQHDLFFLIHSLMKKMRKIADNQLHLLKIGSTEMRILMSLYLFYPNGCDQDAVASKLDIDRSNVGRSLKKLETLKYVKRKRNEHDARSFKVSLTGNGILIKEQIFEVKKKIRNLLLKDIPEKELEHLTLLLNKIDSGLSQDS